MTNFVSKNDQINNLIVEGYSEEQVANILKVSLRQVFRAVTKGYDEKRESKPRKPKAVEELFGKMVRK